jgi:hypothetical protein
MHLRFPVQQGKISGDATCSAKDACYVSLLVDELCMHACSSLLLLEPSMHLFPVQKSKVSGDATCSCSYACMVRQNLTELCMHTYSPLLRCVLAPSMHSRFPVQDAKISGDATCSTEFACFVSLLSLGGGGGGGGVDWRRLWPRAHIRRHSTIHTRTRHLACQ